MTSCTIVIGNKTYSSWSLRGWLLIQQSGAVFEEIVIPLDRPETKAAIRRYNPAGKVPVLRAGDLTIWDTLAIAEYLHERFPDAGLWPAGVEARAIARAVSAEMHSGFLALRRRMPMDLRRPPPQALTRYTDGDLGANISRIQDIWRECRERFGGSGDFLFGDFCAADAFYAPVVTRFVSYGVELDPVAAAYRDAAMSWPAMRDWISAAKDEPWILENP